MRLIFATNNEHKMNEIKDILGEKYKNIVYSLKDIGINVNPDESGKDFIENSCIKSMASYEELKKQGKLLFDDYVIADDTGLCIEFLDGAPGIMSARFMGKETNQSDKNNKILELMKDIDDSKRIAYFVTELSVMNETYDKPMIFEGKIDGYIVKKIEKTGGFGYDPIFAVGDVSDIAKGRVKSFSNLGQKVKNEISHRAIALKKFVQFIEKNHNI